MPGRQDKQPDASAPEVAAAVEPELDIVERRSVDGRVTLLAARELIVPLVARGVLAYAPLTAIDGATPASLFGRGRLVRLELDGARLLAKTMRHGGLLGSLLADRFVGDQRARRLVTLTAELARRGIATPRFAFARARRERSGLMRLDFATHELAGARDGLAFLRSAPPVAARREAVRAAGRTVRALHDAGVEHADLNVKNLLVREGPPAEEFVIDLEKSRREPELSRAAAVRNLERLARSIEKLGLRGAELPRTDLVRFARAYGGADWRAWFDAARRRYRAWAPLHRLAWALGGRAAVTSA